MAVPDWKKDRLAGADLSRLNMLGRRYLNRGETTALDEAMANAQRVAEGN